MSDSRDKPRHQSQTERDLEGIAARRERARSPALPMGVPAFVCEELTGNYEGEELARARALRNPSDRFERLEKKQDEDRNEFKSLSGIVGDLREDVAGMRGELKVLPEILALIKSKDSNEHATTRHRMTSREKVLAATIGAIVAIVTAYIAMGRP